MVIRKFEDVHRMFARRGAPLKQDVAAVMGLSPSAFSQQVADWDARPSPEWIAKFRDAWDACVNRVTTG